MAGIGLVLDQHLPIAVVHVAQHAAGDLEPSSRRAVDHVVEARKTLAEELFETRAGVVQLGEDEAAVVVHVANRIHAIGGVAVVQSCFIIALAQGNLTQRAIGAKRPGVVRAAKELSGVAAGLRGDARAFVRAAVVQNLHGVVGVAHHQDRLGADCGAEIVARDSGPGCRGRHKPRCWRTGAPSRGETPPRRCRRRDGPRFPGSGCGRLRRCRGIDSSASPHRHVRG